MENNGFFVAFQYKKECKMTMELLDTEGDENVEGCSERERDEVVNATEKWSTYVERFSAPVAQPSPKDTPTSPDNEPPTTNHPVSSDQAARGGRGRKRKNTDINKKV